jgi:PAS domain S-box-containing protein
MSVHSKTKKELIKELQELQQKYDSLEEISYKDITERKQIDESQLLVGIEAFQKAFKGHEAVMYVVDMASFFIVDANEAALKFYGYDRVTMLTKRIPDLNMSPEQEIRTEIKNAVAEGRSYYVFKHRLSSGELRDVEIYANPISIRGKNYSFSIVHDITNRKQAELIVNQQIEELKKLDADKDRFITILSHDLRSPFNSILGFLDLLTKNIHEYDIEKIEELINLINNSAQRTFSLLEDILLWVMANSGKIPYEPQKLNFAVICNEVIENLKLPAIAKDIKINCFSTDEFFLFADINMLQTILRNLITNSMKFTNKGGRINIYGKQENSFITITISDNGIGIEPDTLNKLFNVLHKITTEGTANEIGTGLGLLLCKEFVEKHGGKIWVESEEGKGSEFKFTLPC